MFETRLTERGSALIVTIGILMLMVGMGLSFLLHTRMEGKGTKEHQLKKRARFLAESGLQKVLAQQFSDLANGTGPLYKGENWAGNPGGLSEVKGTGNNEDWHGNHNQRLETYELPVQYALNPTFARKDGGKPALVSVLEGTKVKKRGVSGMLPATFSDGSDSFVLRVFDNSTRLNINSKNRYMEDVINEMYRQKRKKWENEDRAPPESKGEALPGTKIFQNRPYSSVRELKRKEVLPEAMYQFLYPHLVVSGKTWVDSSTIKPNPQNRTQETISPGDEDQRIIRYNYTFQRQPRAPVNINRAPVFVLGALIKGISANVLEVQQFPKGETSPGMYQTVELGPVSREPARKIAQKIVTRRRNVGPFQTWNEFESFIDSEIVEGYLKEEGSSFFEDRVGIGNVLKAHFNPNTRFAKWNPDRNASWSWNFDGKRRMVDKSDFTYYSTEFCLFSTGYFEVRSFGRVTDSTHRVRAKSFLSALVHPFRVVRHSTQKTFLQNSADDVDFSSAETFISHPENLQNSAIRKEVKNGLIPATAADGRISVAPRTYELSFGEGKSMNFDYQSGRSDLSETEAMDEFLAKPKRAKDYFTAPADEKRSGRGVMEGRVDTGADKEPRKFSDLLPDGVLLSADRGRFVRVRPRSFGGFSELWWEDGGAVSMWWKPRKNFYESDQPVEVELFHGWFLAENFSVDVPFWQDVLMEPSGISPSIDPGICDQGGIRTRFYNRVLPRYFNQFDSISLGPAAGYRIRFYFKNPQDPSRSPGFYLDISFELFPEAPGESTWISSPPGSKAGGNGLLAGRIKTELPVEDNEDKLEPEAGKWHHLVFDWKPRTFSLRYPDEPSGISDGISTTKKETKLMAGNIAVNGVSTDVQSSDAPHGERHVQAGQVSRDTIPPDQLERFLHPYNMKLTSHLWKEDTKNGPQILHNEDYFPGKVLVENKNPNVEFSNHLWIGGAEYNTRADDNKRRSFAEGTIDEVLISKKSMDDATVTGFKGSNSRYRRNPSNPIYTGKIYRSLSTAENGPDAPGMTFQADDGEQINVLFFAHTQYRPGNDSDSPRFRVELHSDGERISLNSDQLGEFWKGKPVAPSDGKTTVAEDSDALEYQIHAVNMSGYPQNTTPFFEGVTAVYTTSGMDQIKYLKFDGAKRINFPEP